MDKGWYKIRMESRNTFKWYSYCPQNIKGSIVDLTLFNAEDKSFVATDEKQTRLCFDSDIVEQVKLSDDEVQRFISELSKVKYFED